MQGWHRSCRREIRNQQAACSRREQEDNDSRHACRNCQSCRAAKLWKQPADAASRRQATAGLVADGRHLANRAREEAENYKDTYRTQIPAKVGLSSQLPRCSTDFVPVQILADRMGLYMQAYTLYSSVRPFGITSIMGCIDRYGPALYMTEPNGVYWGYRGCATGKGRQLAKTEIEKLDLDNITCKDALKHVALM